MDIISINYIIFTLFGYNVSLIELVGVITGLVSVWYAVKINALTWIAGIVNALLFVIIFYQINLYSSMFCNMFFVVTSFIGLLKCKQKRNELKITKSKNKIIFSILIIIGTLILYLFVSYLNVILPKYFVIAQYPLIDSFVTIASIFAVSLMAYKKIESWILWILIDAICVFLYLSQGTLFLSIEYGIFLILSIVGYINWKKQLSKNYI